MGDFSEAAKEIKRQYYRDYRARNKEKTREINRRYWERKAKRAEQSKQEDSENDR